MSSSIGPTPFPFMLPTFSPATQSPTVTPGTLPPEVTATDSFTTVPSARRHGRFDPAADVLPSMDWLNPLSYRMANPNKLPYRQASERTLVADVMENRTPKEMEAAERLSKIGMDTLWYTYAQQFEDAFGIARGRSLKTLLQAAIDEDGIAFSLEKKRYNEPRPYEVGVKSGGDSYPSGHSSTAYAAATVLAAAWPERGEEFFKAAANVAKSRVYLGMHFAGDVSAGARLGMKVGKGMLRSEPEMAVPSAA